MRHDLFVPNFAPRDASGLPFLACKKCGRWMGNVTESCSNTGHDFCVPDSTHEALVTDAHGLPMFACNKCGTWKPHCLPICPAEARVPTMDAAPLTSNSPTEVIRPVLELHSPLCTIPRAPTMDAAPMASNSPVEDDPLLVACQAWKRRHVNIDSGNTGLSPKTSDQAVQNYSWYRAMARTLGNTNQVRQLCDLVERFYGEEWNRSIPNAADDKIPRKFFAVSAPSGAGKTQMAFNLQEHDDRFNVLHLALAVVIDASDQAVDEVQPVYLHESISLPSRAMVHALNVDYDSDPTLRKTVVSAKAILERENLPLRTIELLARCFDITDELGRPIAQAHLLRREIWDRVGRPEFKLPVVVVDEAWSAGDAESVQRMVLLRSILRACGVAAIFMGTTVQMIEMIIDHVPDRYSRLNGNVRPWARLISLLPRAHLTSRENNALLDAVTPPLDTNTDVLQVATRAEVSAFLSALAALASQRVSSADCMNSYVLHVLWNEHWADLSASIDTLRWKVARKVFAAKAQLRSANGVRGQVQFFLGDHLGSSDCALINSHFARFDADHELQLSGHYVLTASGERFTPCPAFPRIQEDPLLHLVLGGCCTGRNHTQPFVLETVSNRVSVPYPLTAAAALLLTRARETEAGRRTAVNLANRNATAREGNELECATTIAIICASQAGGVGGVSARNFLLHLVAELQALVPAHPLEWENPSDLDTWWSGGDMTVPFFPCLSDTKFPSEVLRGIGRYERTKNQAEIDGRGTDEFGGVVLTVECKNHEGNVDGKVIEKVLRKFREKGGDSLLGIAVVSRLANIQKTLSDHDVNVLSLVVNNASGTVNLKPVGKLMPEEFKVKPKLFCVIECDLAELQKEIKLRMTAAWDKMTDILNESY